MARKPTGNPTGRPKREFDERTFEGLCHVQCTVPEIEAVLHTRQHTLEDWCQRTYGEDFGTCYERFSQGGKASLRRTQFQLAQKSSSMAIWLGKIVLGQKDPEEFGAKRLIGALEQIQKLKIIGDDERPNDTNTVQKTG